MARAAVKEGVDQAMGGWLLRPFVHSRRLLLFGVMGVTALFSMWMSNTATTAFMLTLTMPLLAQVAPANPCRRALLLAVPFAANIGGLGTPIASPPNAIALGYLRSVNERLGFLEWMMAAAIAAAVPAQAVSIAAAVPTQAAAVAAAVPTQAVSIAQAVPSQAAAVAAAVPEQATAIAQAVPEASQEIAQQQSETAQNEVVENPAQDNPQQLTATVVLSYGTFLIEWFADGSTVEVTRTGEGSSAADNEITIANLGDMTSAQRAALQSALAAPASQANGGTVVVEVPGSGNVITVSPI